MSTTPLRCSTCQAGGRYVRGAPFPPGQEAMYGVVWRCPTCQDDLLDVCPLGPLAPDDRTCMNCGGPYRPNEEVCPLCGLSREACPAALGVTEAGLERAAVTAQSHAGSDDFMQTLPDVGTPRFRTLAVTHHSVDQALVGERDPWPLRCYTTCAPNQSGGTCSRPSTGAAQPVVGAHDPTPFRPPAASARR